MDLNRKRRTRDGMKLGDWEGVERCKPHGIMIDGDNTCPTCDAKAEDDKVKAAKKDGKKDKKPAKEKKDKDAE